MAAAPCELWTFTIIVCLLTSFNNVTADENIKNHRINATAASGHYATYNATDNYSPTTEAITQSTSDSSTEPHQPTAAAKPLPVSGSLLTAVTDVDILCPCDEHCGVCDINCCCDLQCGEEVALFTTCSVLTVSINGQLCSWDAASYSLFSTTEGYSEILSSVRMETSYDIFCIQSQNCIDGLYHLSPALPTDSNFDLLFEQYTSFNFGLEENSGQVPTAQHQTSSEYQYGDEIMVTAGESGDTGMFWLPAPGVTADCVDTSPAAFLKDESRVCSRSMVLAQDCRTVLALNMDTYTNIQFFAGRNNDAAVVPVKLATIIVQSIDGTQTELRMSGGENASPVFLNTGVCANIVLQAAYVIKYSPAGEIVNVTVSLVLGFIRGSELPLKQEFYITFVQDIDELAVQYSGNPGYAIGLPIVFGSRTPHGIVRSTSLTEAQSLLYTAEEQDCLHRPYQRYPVLFGLNSVSGCILRLEDATNCFLVSQMLLDLLRGPSYPQFVATFGNSPLNSPLDWVQIKNNFSPEATQSCSIPLSVHLEIEWTKHGSMGNSQPRIVSIKEVIQTNTSSLDLMSGGSRTLSITKSLAFIPVSAAALPGYKAVPTISAKLPYDFFFPFV